MIIHLEEIVLAIQKLYRGGACRNMPIDISYIKVPHLLIYVDILLRIIENWKKNLPFTVARLFMCTYIKEVSLVGSDRIVNNK